MVIIISQKEDIFICFLYLLNLSCSGSKLSLAGLSHLIISVFGHQIADEDLVGGFHIEDLEPELERVADLGGVDVAAAAFRDLHYHVR